MTNCEKTGRDPALMKQVINCEKTGGDPALIKQASEQQKKKGLIGSQQRGMLLKLTFTSHNQLHGRRKNPF